jgi:XisH protein
MPAKDLYHDTVKTALRKEGWTITDDPYLLHIGKRTLYADLGAERLIAAEQANCQIVVEIKSFVGASDIRSLEEAFGQFMLYHKILTLQHSPRQLYLAVNELTYTGIFSEEIGTLILQDPNFRLFTFEEDEEVILQWIPKPITQLSLQTS